MSLAPQFPDYEELTEAETAELVRLTRKATAANAGGFALFGPPDPMWKNLPKTPIGWLNAFQNLTGEWSKIENARAAAISDARRFPCNNGRQDWSAFRSEAELKAVEAVKAALAEEVRAAEEAVKLAEKQAAENAAALAEEQRLAAQKLKSDGGKSPVALTNATA